jgi:Sec7-like guanine-nucleotide exchange factor
MQRYAEQYCSNNPGAFSTPGASPFLSLSAPSTDQNADTAYILAFSLIILNTDAHNPAVRNRMTKAEFVRNNRGIDDGRDLPRALLESLYDRIVGCEIKMEAAPPPPPEQTLTFGSPDKVCAAAHSVVLIFVISFRTVRTCAHGKKTLRWAG